MIVLTTGAASLARLMRRDGASQHLAPRQVHGHQHQGDQAEPAARPKGGVHPAVAPPSPSLSTTAHLYPPPGISSRDAPFGRAGRRTICPDTGVRAAAG